MPRPVDRCRPGASPGRSIAAQLLCLVTAVVSSSCIGRSASGPDLDDPTQPAEPATVRLLVGERHQTLEGFGASVAWYIDRAVGSGAPGLHEVIFSDLGLDILRLRNRYQRSEQGDRDLSEEVTLVQRATQLLGRRPRILLSSWSPPARLKQNAQERCRSDRNCTLERRGGKFVYQQFADYWYESLRHYASLGLTPDYVSIQNEPDFIPPDWEGCRFDPGESSEYPGYDRALEAVATRLATLPSPPRLIGPEVLGIHWDRPQKYLHQLRGDLLYAVAHHLYERGNDSVWDWRDPGPDSFVDEMRAVARAAAGKPLFQTEFSTHEDRGQDGGFETAWLIHHSLVEEGVSAFLYWDLVWAPPGGMVSVDSGRFKLRDQYHALRHYARFTDPGYVRIGARTDRPTVLASAFVAPWGTEVTVVVLNTGRRPASVTIDPAGFAVRASAHYLTAFRPGRTRAWEDLGSLPPDGVVALPARSVATIVLTGQSSASNAQP